MHHSGREVRRRVSFETPRKETLPWSSSRKRLFCFPESRSGRFSKNVRYRSPLDRDRRFAKIVPQLTRSPLPLVILLLAAPESMAWSDQVSRVEKGPVYVTRVKEGVLSCGRAKPTDLDFLGELYSRFSGRTEFEGTQFLTPDAAEIRVIYQDFPRAARRAFQRAVDIWARVLDTRVPIEIEARFASSQDTGRSLEDALAFAGPKRWKDLGGQTPLLRPSALANQLHERDYFPDDADVHVTFYQEVDWYFGLDGDPGAEQIDFVSLALHEIGHGLGFADSFSVNPDGEAEIGAIPTVYDYFVGTWETPLRDFSSGSPELLEALTGIKLFWLGKHARDANHGWPVMLWAPAEYSWSSIVHVDRHAYPPGTPDSLMAPGWPSGTMVQEIGPITRGMLQDVGWQIQDPEIHLPLIAIGEGWSSEIVLVNRSAEMATVAVEAWGSDGVPLNAAYLFDSHEFRIGPRGSLTLSSRVGGAGAEAPGSLVVSSDHPVSATVQLRHGETISAGIVGSPELRSAVAPVRRSGNLGTALSIRNVELSEQTVELRLLGDSGQLRESASLSLPSQGTAAGSVDEIFPAAFSSPFQGSVEIRANGGRISLVVLQVDASTGVATPLPALSLQ